MLFFSVIATLLIAFALGVVLFKNPIYSALSLIANMILIAVLFADLQAHFLAAVQIVVYAGAIMVLVMFVLMLLNIKVEPISSVSASLYLISGGALGLVFVLLMGAQLFDQFGRALPVASANFGTVKSIGALLFTKYLFPFEAASVLIMAGIVGAVMLAKREHGGKRV